MRLFRYRAAALAAVCLLTGCAAPSSSAVSSTPKTELVAAVFEGGYGGRAFWDAVEQLFEERHPDVDVVLLCHPEIGEVIRPNVIAGNPPDFIYLPSTNNSYVTRGMIEDHSIEDITDVMQELSDRFLPGFLESRACQPYGDGHIYLAPLYYSATGLWYNQTFFEENGLEIPTDWDEFFALGETAHELGRALFTYQGLYPSYFECMLIPAIASAAGEEAMRACETFQPGAWQNPKVVQVLENIARIGRDGYLLEGSTAFDHIEAQSRWLAGEALFHPNGCWVESEMAGYPREEGFEFGFAVAPMLDAEQDQPYIYAAIDEMFIPKAAKQKELAKEFLKFLYSDEVIALNAQLAKGIPPIKGAASLLEGVVSDAVLRSYDVFEDGYLPYITSYAMLPSGELVPRNAIYDRVGSVLDGTLRVEDWVAELEEIGTMLRQEEA